MNRRNFLQLAALAVAGQAAERVWPFRVYSIPKNIVVAEPTLFESLLRYQNAVAGEMSLYGIPFYATDDYSGTYMGISRLNYPDGIFSTKEISLEAAKRLYPPL